MKTITFLLVILFILLFTSYCPAQDVEGSKDHPMFNRLSGFYINEYSSDDFGSYEFYYLDKDEVVEGKKTMITYVSDKEVGALKVIRNFSNAVKKIGGQAFEDGENRAVLIIKKGMAETWAEVYAYPDSYYLTIIEKGEVEQEITANAILEELNKTGKAVLYINFDSENQQLKKNQSRWLNK